MRQKNPQEYGKAMNKIFGEIPGVFHYSWADLERKIRNFRDFWERCWSNLYNEDKPVPRFPNVSTEEQIKQTARKLLERGGEHETAETFKLERTNPAVMSLWLRKDSK
jgi:hypothetical protein